MSNKYQVTQEQVPSEDEEYNMNNIPDDDDFDSDYEYD